jgi:hypothetical protein
VALPRVPILSPVGRGRRASYRSPGEGALGVAIDGSLFLGQVELEAVLLGGGDMQRLALFGREL